MADEAKWLKNLGGFVWRRVGDASVIAWLWGFFVASTATSAAGAPVTSDWHVRAVVASWFFGALAVSMSGIRLGRFAWDKAHPPLLYINAHGGRSVALELYPSISGDFYGTAWLLNDDAQRRLPFDLSWGTYAPKYKRIRGGDKIGIVIASLEYFENEPHIVIFQSGQGGTIFAQTVPLHLRDIGLRHRDGHLRDHLVADSPWLRIRVEFRAKQFPQTWERFYRFRLKRDAEFEIESIMPS